MAYGPVLSGSNPVGTITPGVSNYTTPSAYQQAQPYLDDVCIEYSRASVFDKVYNYDAIENMIVNVLYTRIGERDFEPTFGSNVMNLLFEPNDSILFDYVEIEIYDRVRYWVPYIDFSLAGILIQNVPQYQAFRVAFVYRNRTTGISRAFNAFLTQNTRGLI